MYILIWYRTHYCRTVLFLHFLPVLWIICVLDVYKRQAWFLINLFDQSYWIIGSVIGALLGQVLPFDFTGIDFSMTALFVVILLDQVLAHPKAAGRCAVTGLLAGIICLFIFGSGNFLLPALIITVLFITDFAQDVYKRQDDRSNGCTEQYII